VPRRKSTPLDSRRNPDAAEGSFLRRPTDPGDGTPQEPVPVSLTDVDLKSLAEEFSSEIDYQYDAQGPYRGDISRWLKVYRGRPKTQTKTYPLDGASNVVVKLAKIYCDQVIARIFQGITGPQPQFIVSELNKKFAENCKPYERYLDWSQQNMWNQKAFLLPYIQDCVKLGTAIGYNDFVNEPVVRYDDQTKQTVVTGVRKGPRPTWVAREDFLCPVGFPDIQQAPWIAHRTWFSWDLLERLRFRNFIENLDELKGHSDDEDEVKLERRRNRDEMSSPQSDDRFGLWSPWWVWFRRDLDQDGWPEEYVMLLHNQTKTILRLVANPSPAGTRPYFASKFISVEGEFDGIGIPEDVESLQEEASTIHNQRRDRAHLANIVMYIAKMSGQLPDSIRPRSGLVIKTPGGREDIQEFHPSTNVPIDIAEEDSVMRLGSLTVGMNDVDLGKISSPVGRAAATSIMALMQEGARRFDLNVTGIRAALTEEAHQVTELWQVYGLPDKDESGSPEQVLDDKDAALVRQLIEQPVSLRGLISIQLNASTTAVNKEVEKQSNIQLYGIVQGYMQQVLQMAAMIGNPQVPPELKAIILHGVKGQDKLLEKIFQSHNAFDLDSVLASDVLEEFFSKAIQQPPMPMMPPGGPPGQQQGPQAAPVLPFPKRGQG
jgi:hypothetical protein